jgi:hypothetical protein
VKLTALQQWVLSAPTQSLCDMEKIYDLVPRTDDVFNLNRSDLELHDELGAGNFGSVMRGTYRHKGMQIPVAVKTLKKDDMPTAEVSFLLISLSVSFSYLATCYV